MNEDEQTQSAFSAPNRRDAYLQNKAEQKGLSYTDILFDNIFGLDNEYESAGEAVKKAFVEDPYGTIGGMATSAYEGAVDFVRNPYEGVKGIVEETAGSIKRVATENLDEKLNRMYGVTYEEATPDQVTKARESNASDVMTVAGVIPAAKVVGAVGKELTQGIVDLLPERRVDLTETKLPYKATLGPRAGSGKERPSDKKAEALGFKDTVYHSSTREQEGFSGEFTEFDLGKTTGGLRTGQDLLGVHVGTARAAAERNYYARGEDKGELKGYTMELRARTDDPVTKEEIAKLLNKKPKEFFDKPTGPFSEKDLKVLLNQYNDLLYKSKDRDYISAANAKERERVTAIKMRKELAREGFTHIPYINDVEDPGSTSLIMLVDRPKGSPAVLRDATAEFDPKKITSPDLRFAEGGMTLDEQTLNAFSKSKADRARYSAARLVPYIPEQKGLSYTDLLFDNIFGIDNDYETGGEAFRKAFQEDSLGTIKDVAVNTATGLAEGLKDLVTKPVETVEKTFMSAYDAADRITGESLDERLKRMYGVSYKNATDDQVTKAREATASDAMATAAIVPALKGASLVGKGAAKAAAVDVLPELAQSANAIIRLDDVFRGEGKITTSLATATKPYAVRLTGQSQIDDMIKSGTIRPKEGGYGKDKKSTLYFGEMDEAIPNSVFTRPTEGKEYSIVADSSKIAGREGPIPLDDLLHIWTKKDGELVDVLPEIRQKNTSFDQTSDALGTAVLGATLTAKPKLTKPRMFATTEDGKLKLNPESLMEFYSPTVDAIKSMEFPSKGYKGSELVKFLQTKAPGVRRAELDAMDIGIDPMKRYTREEAVALAEKKAYKVTAKEYDDPANTSIQRQQVKDREVSSTTLVVDAVPNSPDSPAFYPNLDRTHYNDSTIAHSRVSIRENNNGENYLLVEEIQSDLVQKGAAKSRGPVSRDVAYSELLENMPMGKDDKAFFKKNKEALTEYFKIGSEDTRLSKAKKDGLPVSAEEEAKLEARRAKLRETFDIEEMGRAFGNKDYDAKTFLDRITNYSYESPPIAEKRMRAIGKSPLTEDSDAVRLALQVAMSKASQEGVSSIVIPNLQRIVTSGRARLGSKEYDSYMAKSSGFTKTYKDGVQNFISQLKEQFGDGIQIKTIDLPYFSDKGYANGVEQTLDNTAIQIDFSGLKDVDFNIGSFAEGGMVEEEQMNRLMQQGGMADDGMSREPVTGNNIPPGALASEVRDDVDAKLSGGEYVVPADVLRYYGVRFFEDLRSQAKQGMMEMESAGRIGGVPVDPRGVPMQGQDEELTPEEEQMLAQAMSGMAEGGTVFNRGDFTMDSNAMTSKVYFNPTTGKKQSINFLGGQPLGGIPDGFVPWTQALQDTYDATKPATPKPKKKNNNGDDGFGNPEVTTNSYDAWADENYEAITNDPFKFGMDLLKNPNDDGGLFGVLTGKDKDILNIAGANAALKRLEAQNKVDSPEYRALTEEVKKYVGGLSLVEKGLISTGVVGMGNQYDAAIRRKEGENPPATPAPTPASATVKPDGGTNDNDNDDNNGGTSYRPPVKDSSGGSFTNSGYSPASTPAAPAATPTPKPVTRFEANQYTSNNPPAPRPAPKPLTKFEANQFTSLAKGGLVAKPKKPRAKTKGLAGKQ